MQETLNSKKHGDTAFRARDFATAIDCYTQVSVLHLILICILNLIESKYIEI